MKNVRFSSREQDLEILAILVPLGFAVFVGSILPTPEPSPSMRLLYVLLCISLGVFVWGAFNIMKPAHYDPRWQMGEVIVVPLVWLLLVFAFVVFVSHWQADWNAKVALVEGLLQRKN